MEVFLQKERNLSRGAHETGAAISGPRIAGKIFYGHEDFSETQKNRLRLVRNPKDPAVLKIQRVVLVAHDCGYPLSRYTCRATLVATDFLDFIAFTVLQV